MKKKIMLMFLGAALIISSFSISAANSQPQTFDFWVSGTGWQWTAGSYKYYTANNKNRNKSAYVINTTHAKSKQNFRLTHQLYGIPDGKKYSKVWKINPKLRTDFANTAHKGYKYKLNVRREFWYDLPGKAYGSWSADNNQY